MKYDFVFTFVVTGARIPFLNADIISAPLPVISPRDLQS